MLGDGAFFFLLRGAAGGELDRPIELKGGGDEGGLILRIRSQYTIVLLSIGYPIQMRGAREA